MSISVGSRLGPYEIKGPLGAGGMGEVYRARDTRLGRDVAVKVLPPSTTDEGRLQRFEQEARATAALNHPNILAVFDIGQAKGGPYIVADPTGLFRAPVETLVGYQYAVTRDGQRFLVNAVGNQPPPTVTIETDWPSLLKK